MDRKCDGSSRPKSRRTPLRGDPELLFGIQQWLEGALWLTFPDRAPLLNIALTHVYSLFSHVVWPIYVPLAAIALEKMRRRRRVLIGTGGAGAAVGLYLLSVLIRLPIVATVTGGHIAYESPYFYASRYGASSRAVLNTIVWLHFADTRGAASGSETTGGPLPP